MQIDRIEYVTEADTAVEITSRLTVEAILGVDIETTGLDCHSNAIRLVSVATLSGRVWVFDLDNIPVSALAAISGTKWIAYNAQFEQAHMTQAGFEIPMLHDAMLLDRLYFNPRRCRNLAEATLATLDVELSKELQTSDWTGDLSTEQIEYAGLDALAAVRIGADLLPRIDARGQGRLYRLWLDTSRVLSDLSRRGHRFAWQAHADLWAGWVAEQESLEADLDQILSGANPRSADQLGEWLRKVVPDDRIARWPLTDKKQALKTGADALALAADVEGMAALLQYKAVKKLASTYGKGYAKHRHPLTDRLHPTYSIGNTVTGRLAASKPNTQNPPRKAEFRQLFVPDDGMVMVGADFGQIELRVAALLSGDAAMLAAYAQGDDLHRLTAAAVTGKRPDGITADERQLAKAINFGSLYGQKSRGLAATATKNYGVTMTEAQAAAYLVRIGEQFPQLDEWRRQQVAQAKSTRRVSTPLGMVRDFDLQGAGYLAGDAMNVPVQGGAAEIMLETLTRLPAALASIGAVLSHHIHDEIVIESPQGSESEAESALSDAMVSGFLAVFPEAASLGLAGDDLVETKTGPSWGEVH